MKALFEPSDDIQDFVRFLITVGAQNDPGLLRPPIGATDEQVTRLQQLVRHPLPEFYKSYMRVFGKDDGNFRLYKSLTSIDHVLPFYEEQAKNGYRQVLPHWVTIAPQTLEGGRELLYLPGQKDKEPQVISSDGNLLVARVSSSFRNWVYQHAYRWFRMPGWPTTRSYVTSAKSVAPFRELFESKNLKEVWFSDDFDASAENDQLRVNVNLYRDYLSLAVTAKNARVLDEFTNEVVPLFALVPTK